MAKVSYPDIDKKFEKMSRSCANEMATTKKVKPTTKKKTTAKKTTKKGK